VLLERDPLQDITVTRALRAVVARGRALPADPRAAPARTQAQ
jgi:hypothetical protein